MDEQCLPVSALSMDMSEAEDAETLAGDLSARIFAIFFIYLVTARLGLAVDSVNTFAALIWPPSGIALAAFILYGWRIWPAIFCAAFLVNVSVGAPLLSAFGIAIGNTLGPLLGAHFLRWYSSYSSYHPALPRLRDTIGIMLNAAFVPLLTASVGVGSLWLGGKIPSPEFWHTWGTWWLGDLLGILILTPFALKWFNRPIFERTRAELVELMIVLLTVAATAYILFWWAHTSFVYYIFIPLSWAALRTGQRGITLSTLIVSTIAIAATVTGHGPFMQSGLVYLQVFLATLASIVIVFASAVEERRRVVETLKEHTHDLEIALQTIRAEDEAKKEFIAILAHELRNPLATILSSVELITMQGVSTETTPPLLTTINERSRAMVRLLDDLLDISQISKKKLTLQKETISVDEFMDKLDGIVRPLMKRYGHDFSLTKPQEPLYLRADPIRLEQILMNLLANAARYTQAHGFIEVTSSKERHMLAIHIRDSGVGIPRGMLRRIFEPFFQVNRERVKSEGMGIGLTLTRELIEMHGGSIEAKSEGVGAGSEFIVRLPLTSVPDQSQPLLAAPLPEEKRVKRESHDHSARVFSILIVDDNEAAIEALSQLLRLRGHSIEVAHTGKEAIEKADATHPEVILLDIGLPDMTGYEVAATLRREQPSVPYFIIALTGYGQDDDKAKAKKAGIDQHLVKPAGLKEIQAALRKYPRHVRNAEV
jgi:signal transduction histidine kinase/ActR/RegA family two-component response regulator